MFAAFSMDQKHAANTHIQKTKAKLRTALIGKDKWHTAYSFLLPQNEIKVSKIHKSFSQFPPKFKNISKKIGFFLDGATELAFYPSNFYREKPNWIFFEHFKTQKMFAQNFEEKNEWGWNALHCAAKFNEVEIANVLIEAGADIDEQVDNWGVYVSSGWTALHFAADKDNLKIGRVLVDAGASIKIKIHPLNDTALDIAERWNHIAFAKMLRKNMDWEK